MVMVLNIEVVTAAGMSPVIVMSVIIERVLTDCVVLEMGVPLCRG